MIEAILPPAVEVEWTRGDAEGIALFPEEEAAVLRAVRKRRREFATGRACARAALARLGLPAQPIPPGDSREPLWPAGIVGSITHCEGYRACAVARAADIATVGIDAEPDEPLPSGVLEVIARPEELTAVREALRLHPGVNWDRLLFSAKECVFKAWFPLTGLWLGFEDAALGFDRSRGTFSAHVLRPPGAVLSGSLARPRGGRPHHDRARAGALEAVVTEVEAGPAPARCRRTHDRSSRSAKSRLVRQAAWSRA